MDGTIITISIILTLFLVGGLIYAFLHAVKRDRWLWVVIMFIAPGAAFVYLLIYASEDDGET